MGGRIRSRLTYSNVVASIALFAALGGGAYAATALPKNSVGTKQIKKKAVTNSKLAANAVTTGKVKNGSLLKDDFAAGQLPAGGTGPAGPKGDKGDKGDTGAPGAKGDPGAPAADATKVFFKAPRSTGNTTVYDKGGLTIVASCDASGLLHANATTSVNDSEIQIESNSVLGGPTWAGDPNFDTGNSQDIVSFGSSSGYDLAGHLTYATPDGSVVTFVYASDGTNSFGNFDGCGLMGIAEHI